MRKISALILALLMAAATLTFVAAPASAGTTLLCKGFSSCNARGYDDSGFSKVYKTRHWGMIGGHNCTNYVAYRLTHHGRVTTHKSGFTSAANWSAAAKAHGITRSSKPQVGDIAWWAKGSPGSKTGHVAYVEQVYPNGTIRISEDNYKGDFQWKTITPGSTYPNLFIRFPQSDGSAWGKVSSVKKSTATVKGRRVYRLTVKGWATESDNAGGSRLLPSWNGPRDTTASGVRTGSPTSPIRREFTYTWSWDQSVKRPTRLYLYALNADGTAGSDHYMGSFKTGY